MGQRFVQAGQSETKGEGGRPKRRTDVVNGGGSSALHSAVGERLKRLSEREGGSRLCDAKAGGGGEGALALTWLGSHEVDLEVGVDGGLDVDVGQLLDITVGNRNLLERHLQWLQ